MLCFFHRFYEAPTKARHWIFGFIDFMFPKGNIPFIKPYLSPKIYKTLGKNKTSALYKPKTIFNKNNCPIICDIYRKSLSLSIENKEINKPLKLVWLPV